MSTQKIIAIGASTGGVEALRVVISAFPRTMPPVLIVQHMPPHFTRLFSERLDSEFNISVKEAQSGDLVVPGQVYIAPGGKHMKLVKKAGVLQLDCFVGEKVQYAIPSVDVLFYSVAEIAGQNAVGVILTGVGGDGANGLLEMRKNGAKTIGQDKGSCVVYGMPKAAFELKAVEHVLPLDKIASKVLSLV